MHLPASALEKLLSAPLGANIPYLILAIKLLFRSPPPTIDTHIYTSIDISTFTHHIHIFHIHTHPKELVCTSDGQSQQPILSCHLSCLLHHTRAYTHSLSLSTLLHQLRTSQVLLSKEGWKLNETQSCPQRIQTRNSRVLLREVGTDEGGTATLPQL